MFKISGLINTDVKNSSRGECPARSASAIPKVVAKNPLKILLNNFSAVKKKLPERMDIFYVRRSPATDLAVTGFIVVGKCQSLNMMDNKATAAIIWQPQPKVTKLNIAASAENISNSASTNQESLLSRPINIKRGPTLKQKDL